MNLFIGNLPYSMDSAKLGQIFAPAGTVVSAKVIVDKYSGRSRGFGFNGTAVEGRPLVVNEAKPPKQV